MNKRNKGLLIGLIGVIILIIILDATTKKPVDWFPSYVHTDNRALGTEVFYKSLSSLDTDIQHVEKSPFESFQDSLQQKGTYFFLNEYINLTKEEIDELLEWVDHGNTAFIASQGIPKPLLDTLDLNISFYLSNSQIEYQPSFNFVEEKLQLESAKKSRKAFEYLYFSEIDSTKTQSLGFAQSTLKGNEDENSPHINFIKVSWGDGYFLCHLAPQIFTNYFMVDGSNSDYSARTLNYIDFNKPILWDNYYKAGKEKITNPLYYLLSNIYLKTAYYLIIISSLLFILFGGKRKQRPIPIIDSVKNKSREFAQTIAGMYLDKKDHKAIAQKQIQSFLDKIRNRYRLSTQKVDAKFLKELSQKTNQNYEDLEELFKYIEFINTSETISEKELISLDHKLSSFNY
ncbi:hypothetical protein pgond44_12477 [Psychroflexus gondwanensis ACAM 44]|jgi:hypothetical protein|uniref:DUF4350 domain-containing protein n=1 Tax=Psychroflexus gondwanensis ACAM 44 TaxID=1189619 RepID=N1WMX1_9FLAO|nr:DUF4350 domain-containing protein [Psychroflexus gondwanensis]EMY80340.1 hypothetical protein pgond44_12477 [Psychroflexus gondwanensis ACAM 44]